MFEFLHTKRVHEPLSVGSLLAAGCTLHAAWILNLLRFKVPAVAQTLTLAPGVGSISGIYLFCAVVYALVFGVTVLWLRNKDCSGVRDRAFWFFLAAVLSYGILTIPFVFGFELVA